MVNYGNNKTNNNGLTLIELLIVIMIIAILSAGVLVLINPVYQFQKARDAERLSDISKIQAALEVYRDQNGGYPGSNSSDKSIDPLTNDICNTSWSDINSSATYLSNVPCDPSDGTAYKYIPDRTNTSDNNGDSPTYCLYSCMEINSNINQSTTQCTPPGDICNSATGKYVNTFSNP